MFQTEVVEKIRTHFMLNKPRRPRPECRSFYELMWTNMVQPDRPQMAI